jgi:oligopeptide transport system substrate-binding protein
MKNMIKKVLLVWLLVISGITLAACGAKVFTVTFDSQGGSAVTAQEVEEDLLAVEPTEPTRPDLDGKAYSFTGWFTDAAATSAYDFATPVTEDLTLYAGWTLNTVVSFNTKTTETIAPVLLGEDGGTITTAPVPTREGYAFGGWFFGRPGLTWLEQEAIEFPLEVTDSVQLHAYWEPLDSKAVNYSDGETYTTSLTADSALILNPLVYRWSHEDAYIDLLSTALYSTEVDWDLAIEEGVADYVGDFSKIIDRTFSIEALDYVNILVGATQFPIDSQGEEHLTPEGKYDREAATSIMDTEWTFKIRDDMVFENGEAITAYTFEYTLQQYLDGAQNNFRANNYFKTEENKQGSPIVNAYEYFTGTADWEDVGFKVIDDYTFTVTWFEEQSQSAAIGFGTGLRLVEPLAYEESLSSEGTNSTYGTPGNPYVSYGAYLIKSWDENQRVVFNKNYDYVLRGTINYKSQVIEIVDDVDQRMQLFEDGNLSVAGLTQDYYAEYAENPNVKKSWDGYPQYIIVNTRGSLPEYGGTHEVPDIMFDQRFRQALFYGFDRIYYANNVYAPNTASLLHVPMDMKSYNQDPLYYSESPQYLTVLENADIDPETMGYIPSRAVTLFNAAYDAWIAEGNTGPVTLKLAGTDGPFELTLYNYVKQSYEELFGSDKLVIDISTNPQAAHDQVLDRMDFDIVLTAVGFGSSTGIYWQFGAIGGFAGEFWHGFGLANPFDASNVSAENPDGYADYWITPIEIDLSNTWAYLEELGVEEIGDNADLMTWYDWLKEETDPVSGDVVKAAGILNITIQELAITLYSDPTPFDATAKEPFPGATTDTYNIVAAMQEEMMDFVNLIPTVTRSSAIIYADNVVITWPFYHGAFIWGPNRYRYLNTDADFADGLYNPNEA